MTSHHPVPRRSAPAVTGARTPKTWPLTGREPVTAAVLPGAPLAAVPPTARPSGHAADTASAGQCRVPGTGAPADRAVRAPPGRRRPVDQAPARPGRTPRGSAPP